MTDKNHILDERLVAFLDGELVPDAHAKLAAAVEQDDGLQLRLRNMQFDQPALQSAYHNLRVPDLSAHVALIEKMDDSQVNIQPAVSPAANDNRSWRVVKVLFAASALAAAFAIGLFSNELGFDLSLDKPAQQVAVAAKPGWRQSVADYMALYSKSTLDRMPVTVESNDRNLALLSQDIGLELAAAQNQIDDLQLYRGQILNLRGKPLVQLAYLDGGKIPVAFCIIKNDKGRKSMEFERRNDMNIAHWSSSGHSFMVIGDLPEERIAAIAKKLSVNF